MNGDVLALNISYTMTIEVNFPYLASGKISLISTGPKVNKRISISLKSKDMDFSGFLTCLVQLLIVALIALFILLIMIGYQRTKDSIEKKEGDDLIVKPKEEDEDQMFDNDFEDSEDEDSYFGDEKVESLGEKTELKEDSKKSPPSKKINLDSQKRKSKYLESEI